MMRTLLSDFIGALSRHPRARPAGPSSSRGLFSKKMDCRVKPRQ
jgi:hypothetical protein